MPVLGTLGDLPALIASIRSPKWSSAFGRLDRTRLADVAAICRKHGVSVRVDALRPRGDRPGSRHPPWSRAADALGERMVDRAADAPSIRRTLAGLRQYRHLLRNLVLKDLKLKYRGSVFGFLWSLANPLLMIVVYTVAFTNILQRWLAKGSCST